MSFFIHSVLFIIRTTILLAAILFGVKWEKEKKRADELQKQLDEAQKKLAEAVDQPASETEETEDQPLAYEQRTSQQRFLLQQFFWATIKRLFRDEESQFMRRENEIVYLILSGKRLKEVGEEMGLSEGRVREIWEKALRKWANYANQLQQKEAEIVSLKEKIERLESQLYDSLNPELLNKPIGECDFSVRVLNSLKAAEIETVADLVRTKKTDLLKIRNVSQRAVLELSEWLEQHGLWFGMNIDKKDIS